MLACSLTTAFSQSNALQLPSIASGPFAPAIRFTTTKDSKRLYAIVLEIPKDGTITIKSLATTAGYWPGKVGCVRSLGGGSLKFSRDETGLNVTLPERFQGQTALALEVRS